MVCVRPGFSRLQFGTDCANALIPIDSMRIKASGFTGIMLEEAQANKARVTVHRPLIGPLGGEGPTACDLVLLLR